MVKKWNIIVICIFLGIFSLVLSTSALAGQIEIEGDSDDGVISYTHANWDTCRDSATGTVNDVSNIITIGYRLTAQYTIYRGFLFFDTSSLQGKLITGAILSVYNESYLSGAGTNDILVTQADDDGVYPHKPLEAGDYDRTHYIGDGGEIPMAGIPARMNITLNETGLEWINTNGWTKLVLRSGVDLERTLVQDHQRLRIYSADEVDTSKRPRLYLNYSTVMTNITPKTSIGDTYSSLHGYVLVDNGENATVGFWYGTTAVSATHFDTNVTVGTYTSNTTFSKSISSLNVGDYYYVRAWKKNDTSFEASGMQRYFMTRPRTASAFNLVDTNATNASFTWSFRPVGAGTTQKAVLRYKEGSYPTSPTDGTSGYNGTGTSVTIDGLNADTTYYFRLWSLAEGTGSPYKFAFSSSYLSLSGSTAGGNYSISLRYENTSYGLIDLTSGSNHTFIVYYEGRAEYNYFNGTAWEHIESGITLSNPGGGTFNITLQDSPRMFEFRWNSTLGANYQCIRKIIPPSGEHDIVFYLRTDLPVFGQSTSYYNNSLIKYLYSFVDQTGKFIETNNPYIIIFKYDNESNKLIIHSEYWGSSGTVNPWLVYEDLYNAGVYCDVLNIPNVGYVPTGTNIEADITITVDLIPAYNFYTVVKLEWGWYGDGLFVDYLDMSSTTNWVVIRVYDYDTGDLINTSNVSYSAYNFTVSTADGINLSKDYKFEIISDVNDDYWSGNKSSGLIPIYSGMAPVTSVANLDSMLELILGTSPIYNTHTGIDVSWTYIGIFSLCFIIMATFGKLNAFVGMLATGMFLTMSGAMISGFSETISGVDLLVIGVFIIALGIIGLMGGVER